MPQPVTQSICRSPARTVLALLALSCAAGPARAQFAFDTLNDPFVVSKRHDVGKHLFSVSNTGRLSGPLLSGGLWVGAVVGTDTLVTTTWDGWRFNLSEFEPATLRAQEEFGEFPIERDIFDTLADDHNLAKSQQDFIVTYYDTLEVDDFSDFDGRPHRPLNLRVRQSSYAWGMDYADDFVLVDYLFTNLGKKTLTKLYLGMFLDGRDAGGVDSYDWVQGFLGEGDAFFPDSVACSFRDPVNFAWYADVDGLSINAQTGAVDSTGNRAAAGFKILRPVDPLLNLNFNWWLSSQEKHQDFGPRKILSNGRPFRDFGGFLGTPEGDKNKYHQLSNGERDYDQVYTAVDHSGDGWLLPPPDAADIANGRFDTHEVISIGPFELSPGQSVPFTVALFVGENFHRDPANFSENYDPLAPDAYYENLDFSGLIESATWARWVYDNPGVDTDGDGFRGEYRVCVSEVELNVDTSFVIDSSGPAPDTQLVVDTTELAPREDTVWVGGDGKPDFRGVTAPPSPEIRYTPEIGVINLEWNGLKSETTPDLFTRKIDFEGYRVYLGLTKRRSDLTIVASYDIEDYAVWYFNPNAVSFGFFGQETEGKWELVSVSVKSQIQALYARGNPDYDPLINGIDNPLFVRDSAFYFAKQDWNQDDLSNASSIHKIYPGAPQPHTLTLSEAFTDDTWYEDPKTGAMIFYEGGELTPDGKRFKYFEYRMVLNNLLPSLVYYVSVTAFDYGEPAIGLPWLESNRVTNAVQALAQDVTPQNQPLSVIVYPNPYRIDGNYREQGFEGRGRENIPGERLREVHFTNLPPVCDITIYSLDGDMIRTIEHRRAPDDPSAMHDSWDVISRNILPVVSGIYYWTVETPDGRTQIGKLVLIM